MTGHVYTEDGRRLYTLPQLAEVTGISYPTLRKRRERGRLPEPDAQPDDRTPLWTKESIMALTHAESYKERDLVAIAIGIAEDTELSPAGYHHADQDHITVPWRGLLDDGLIRLVPDGESARVELTAQGVAKLEDLGVEAVAHRIAEHDRQRPERHHCTVTPDAVLAYHRAER